MVGPAKTCKWLQPTETSAARRSTVRRLLVFGTGVARLTNTDWLSPFSCVLGHAVDLSGSLLTPAARTSLGRVLSFGGGPAALLRATHLSDPGRSPEVGSLAIATRRHEDQ